MNTANDCAIKLIGAAILRLSGTRNDGRRAETRQIVYITDETDKVFLSREACLALGMISPDFPAIGSS